MGRGRRCATRRQLPSLDADDARILGNASALRVPFELRAGCPHRILARSYSRTMEVTMTLTRFRIAVAALALAATPALAQDKVRFQTDWIPSGEHAMYYGGWQKGIFASEGIDVTSPRGYGSGDTVTKLAGGGFDFGVADMAAVMTARARQNVPV